jgi:transposase-like protein
MKQRGRYPAEVRERAVRLVLENQEAHGSRWSAITSVAAKLGCTAETLRKWVQQADVDGDEEPPELGGENRLNGGGEKRLSVVTGAFSSAVLRAFAAA